MEIFKDVQGYEKLYQVSNYGRVKSLPKERQFGNRLWIIQEKFLRQRIHDGYYRVNLCGNGKMKTISVHILVANTFLEKEDNKSQVNHKDLNRLNNHIDNLERTSTRENVQHGRIFGNKKSSKYPGVTFSKTHNKFMSRTRFGSKCHYLGLYENEELAHNAVIQFHKQNNIVNKYIY